MDLVEDERLNDTELCRVTEHVGQHEFICILKVHAKIYRRVRSSPVGAPIYDNNRGRDAHYMVRRYPYSDH